MGGEEGGGAYSRNPTIALDVRDEGARGKEDFFFFFFDKVLSFSLSLVINQQVFSFFHSLSIHILLNPSLPFSTFPPPSLYPSLSLNKISSLQECYSSVTAQYRKSSPLTPAPLGPFTGPL